MPPCFPWGKIMTEALLVASRTCQEDRNSKFCCDKSNRFQGWFKIVQIHWQSNGCIFMLTSACKGLWISYWSMSYCSAFSKPQAIPQILGATKNEEDLCPEKGALEREHKNCLKSFVDWFSHLLRSWPLYLSRSRKPTSNRMVQLDHSVPGIWEKMFQLTSLQEEQQMLNLPWS